MVFYIYVGSYTNEIYTLAFDPDTPSLALVSTLTVGFHPSWLTVHPRDPSIVFAGIEQAEGLIVAVKFDKHGQGTVLGSVSSGGSSPCTLLATDSELLIGNVRTSATRSGPPIQSCSISPSAVRIWHARHDPVVRRGAPPRCIAAIFSRLFRDGPQQREAGKLASTPGYHPPRSQGTTHS